MNGVTCKKEGRIIPFVSTFGTQSDVIAQTVREYWPVIKDTHSEIKEFQEPQIMTYGAARTIHDSFVKADLGGSTKK